MPADTSSDAIPLTPAEYAAAERVLATTAWALGHVHQVARLSGRLFDALRPYHGLGAAEERLLLTAALLHDVGYPADPAAHHKVSARVIRAQLGPPFEDGDSNVIALVARYHRKACPKLRHERYGALAPTQRRLVVCLGGMLRIADGLDRPHDAAVGTISASRHDGRLVLRVTPAGDTPAPQALLADHIAGALRKRDLLERAFGVSVTIRAVA